MEIPSMNIGTGCRYRWSTICMWMETWNSSQSTSWEANLPQPRIRYGRSLHLLQGPLLTFVTVYVPTSSPSDRWAWGPCGDQDRRMTRQAWLHGQDRERGCGQREGRDPIRGLRQRGGVIPRSSELLKEESDLIKA